MMHYKRFLLIALTTLITTSLQSGATLPGILPAQQVWAQTPDSRKGEAHKLYVEAVLQVQNNQTQAAIKSFQQALIIFRDIKDRKSKTAEVKELLWVAWELLTFTRETSQNQLTTTNRV